MTLYRQYRPQKFSEIVGQEHIVRTLANALEMDFLNHAYLLCGPKGTGKTSTARIFAKALTCLKRQNGKSEPCNSCDVCQEITGGRSLDLIEIDAASHRGIDEIRNLRDSVQFLPIKAKKRIFIIDEVHMLTKEAFNALLKTLEEPPNHITFIMATTEPEKVPLTILSRVQRFDFHRLNSEEIKNQVLQVAKSEKIPCAPDAAFLIAQISGGSLRDALTIFEKSASRGAVDKKIVTEVMGLVDFSTTKEFLEHLINRDQTLAMQFLHNYNEQGGDMQALATHLIDTLRKILIFGVAPESQLILLRDLSEDQLGCVKNLARNIAPTLASSLIKRLLELKPLIKVAPIPSLPLELLVIDFIGQSKNIDQI